MHRKKLQGTANTMCRVFCGWRLNQSKPNLVELGSGTLKIDALTGNCSFEEKSISQLTIAEELRLWLQSDLSASNIPIDALTGAKLAVNLSFSVVPWSAPEQEIFYLNGKAIRTEKMNRCVMECDSHVTTDDRVYRSQLTEVQQWPIGWPEKSRQVTR
jgi:hypothetical protein